MKRRPRIGKFERRVYNVSWKQVVRSGGRNRKRRTKWIQR